MMNTKYTFDDELISDLHKDAYGFRPSESFWDFWTSATDDEKQTEWESLLRAMDAREAEQAAEDAYNIDRFEERLHQLKECGARNNAMALHWLDEAYETGGDWEYLEYNLGLPYKYLTKKGYVA